jgi:hypothetical protein
VHIFFVGFLLIGGTIYLPLDSAFHPYISTGLSVSLYLPNCSSNPLFSDVMGGARDPEKPGTCKENVYNG